MNKPPLADETRLPDTVSRPLRLADGNMWGFALPSQRVFPSIGQATDSWGRTTQTISARVEVGYPLEIQQHWDDLWDASKHGLVSRQHEAFLHLATALLRRAHDITESQARELLALPDEDWPELVDGVLKVIDNREF